MILQSIDDVSIIAVQDRGIANQECIALRVHDTVDMGCYGIMIGLRQNGLVRPLRDNLFWFGDNILSDGEWIFVYTGGGSSSQYTDAVDGKSIYRLFWGRRQTIFADSNIVPILFRTDAISLGSDPVDQAQHESAPASFPLLTDPLGF